MKNSWAVIASVVRLWLSSSIEQKVSSLLVISPCLNFSHLPGCRSAWYFTAYSWDKDKVCVGSELLPGLLAVLFPALKPSPEKRLLQAAITKWVFLPPFFTPDCERSSLPISFLCLPGMTSSLKERGKSENAQEHKLLLVLTSVSWKPWICVRPGVNCVSPNLLS